MISATCSLAGTIRDQNQDFITVDEKLRLAVIADGNGPQGAAIAELTTKAICSRLSEIAPVTSGPETGYRLQEAVELAISSCAAEFDPASSVAHAVIWINRGVVAAIAAGHCAIATSNDNWQMQMNKYWEFPVQASQDYMLCSEGITTIYRKAPELPVNPDSNNHCEESHTSVQELLEAFTRRAAATYDGDDRSAILIRLDKSDITAGEPHEIELFENYSKEYHFPLWAPIATVAGIAASGLFAAFKFKKYWS